MRLFKEFCQQIFSIKNKAGRKIITFLGIKLKFQNNRKFFKETAASIKVQDCYDLEPLKKAQKIILFLVPSKGKMSGGVMSIYSICEYTREINPDWFCLISTHPGKFTYARNDEFENNEQVYRWEQIVQFGSNIQEMILHIPEYYVKYFYVDLKENDIKFLKFLPSLQINIMNQNIEKMPNPLELADLKKLTNNITQSIAHDRYATQEVCDKWGIPAHLFSCQLRLRPDKFYYENKDKIILYSNDNNIYKPMILNKLKSALPDYKLVEINGLKFDEFQNAVAKAFVTITFGEGFDGYFLIPSKLGSLGMAVYNEEFFPDKSWLELGNVFKSYDDMLNSIADKILYLQDHNDEYKALSKINREKHDLLYNSEKFKNNLERFYKKEYDFEPKVRGIL